MHKISLSVTKYSGNKIACTQTTLDISTTAEILCTLGNKFLCPRTEHVSESTWNNLLKLGYPFNNF